METQDIWSDFNDELYLFILKRVKDASASNDVFQNTFLKIHKNLSKLRSDKKVKPWIFQIARNEIANHFNKEASQIEAKRSDAEIPIENYQNICCFDKFINNLPEIYNEVIELVYIKGLKQKEAAASLGISLENVKVRISRAKDLLKQNFSQCCKYEFDKNGKLSGEANCTACNTI
ncbi:sigma-70 family RNA polymerase sigma factor [Portibacter lacus]|uniref:RNA polymerase sigma factor SigZ n=1 Tax=Portibacter lacus TaxID=1099794 RepID=A0AA37SS83_9BACT|nr:sigma-70 family RNA polymerase sigma factor [Portibacter lacus]GLR17268.1 RNA polymerase sigma factor SigZ [Portibacter lacus]